MLNRGARSSKQKTQVGGRVQGNAKTGNFALDFVRSVDKTVDGLAPTLKNYLCPSLKWSVSVAWMEKVFEISFDLIAATNVTCYTGCSGMYGKS